MGEMRSGCAPAELTLRPVRPAWLWELRCDVQERKGLLIQDDDHDHPRRTPRKPGRTEA